MISKRKRLSVNIFFFSFYQIILNPRLLCVITELRRDSLYGESANEFDRLCVEF